MEFAGLKTFRYDRAAICSVLDCLRRTWKSEMHLAWMAADVGVLLGEICMGYWLNFGILESSLHIVVQDLKAVMAQSRED